MKLGAEDFIVKPLDLEQLEVAVQKRALQNYDLRRQVDILSEQLRQEQPDEILGNSEGYAKSYGACQDNCLDRRHHSISRRRIRYWQRAFSKIYTG